ncbi:hypothetical protein EVAR_16943_1 [Eumeta japonica]|uniref:Uncharacterized protein n=1 Tax=Eumeta variegata TaxID=151549 RepID=A0A4C1TVR1_EUMVA|nr:hypothetical protein EVAR_16943_1 [Eumeta japonica]
MASVPNILRCNRSDQAPTRSEVSRYQYCLICEIQTNKVKCFKGHAPVGGYGGAYAVAGAAGRYGYGYGGAFDAEYAAHYACTPAGHYAHHAPHSNNNNACKACNK